MSGNPGDLQSNPGDMPGRLCQQVGSSASICQATSGNLKRYFGEPVWSLRATRQVA